MLAEAKAAIVPAAMPMSVGVMGLDKIRVGPTGKLTLEDTKTSFNAISPEVCDRERAYLANIDDDKFLREIIDDANRGNSTFYMGSRPVPVASTSNT